MKELLRESDTDQDYEKCVRCGKVTRYKHEPHPYPPRAGYIQGAGQYCFECTHRQGSYE